MSVRAKKHLGQHFLRDENIARKISESLIHTDRYKKVLEVGPGMGVLTKYLLANENFETWVVEIDRESVAYLEENYPQLKPRIISKDFLRSIFRKHSKNLSPSSAISLIIFPRRSFSKP